jgi:hypothetical protein
MSFRPCVVGVGIGGGAFAEYMVLPATALAALRPLGCIAAGLP